MRMLLTAAVLALFFSSSLTASAYDCSVSCPSGLVIDGINKTTGCTLIYDGSPSDIDSWCRLDYSATKSVTCNSCSPLSVSYGSCTRTSSTSTIFPYTKTYDCSYSSSGGGTGTVYCCDPLTAKSCGGSCGVAACETGLSCSGSKCVNPSCPLDSDCVCDGVGPTPSPTPNPSGCIENSCFS